MPCATFREKVANMNGSFDTLMVAAIAIGIIHTAAGPDHYLPFIVIAKARKWSLSRTAVITVLCGMGHVMSSVVLGMIGIIAGVALGKLEVIESGFSSRFTTLFFSSLGVAVLLTPGMDL